MKSRFYFLFGFFSFLFLFYPGDFHYFSIFAHQRHLFLPAGNIEEKKETVLTHPIPVVKPDSSPSFISARATYVVDLPTFTPIFEKNSHLRLFPASTTKIMTALVVADLYRPSEVITARNLNIGGQSMGLTYGERMTVENLLYGLLVYSGNDAAQTLAQNKDYDQFIALMNQKAYLLKMKNSHFSNPSGLDDIQNYSTVFDLTLASRELLKNPLLSKIVSTKEITVSDVDFVHFHKLVNINRLLGEIPGLRGLKTGQTEEAGENLVSFYKNGNREFLITVMKSTDRFTDTKNIIDWINQNVDYATPTQ